MSQSDLFIWIQQPLQTRSSDKGVLAIEHRGDQPTWKSEITGLAADCASLSWLNKASASLHVAARISLHKQHAYGHFLRMEVKGNDGSYFATTNTSTP